MMELQPVTLGTPPSFSVHKTALAPVSRVNGAAHGRRDGAPDG